HADRRLPPATSRGLRRRAGRGAVIQRMPLHGLPRPDGGSARRARSTQVVVVAMGKDIPRRTTAAVTGGHENYVADFDADGALWGGMVRSGAPQGRIDEIESEEAAGAPGVVAVIPAATLGGDPPKIPIRVYRTDLADGALQPVLAADRVRYVGEPYAV